MRWNSDIGLCLSHLLDIHASHIQEGTNVSLLQCRIAHCSFPSIEYAHFLSLILFVVLFAVECYATMPSNLCTDTHMHGGAEEQTHAHVRARSNTRCDRHCSAWWLFFPVWQCWRVKLAVFSYIDWLPWPIGRFVHNHIIWYGAVEKTQIQQQ